MSKPQFSSDEFEQHRNPARPESSKEPLIVSSDAQREQRLPPGQRRSRKWPVLQAGRVPDIEPNNWQLEVAGLVEHPLRLSYEAFCSLPQVRVFADFHCVEKWSRLDNLWEGVATRKLLGRAGVRPEASFVLLHAADDGWTTGLPLEHFLADDALLAHRHDGKPLSVEHGGPVRAIVPRLYAWKSAKWLCKIELLDEPRRGYWESRGYHDLGDPWQEQRLRPGAEKPPGFVE